MFFSFLLLFNEARSQTREQIVQFLSLVVCASVILSIELVNVFSVFLTSVISHCMVDTDLSKSDTSSVLCLRSFIVFRIYFLASVGSSSGFATRFPSSKPLTSMHGSDSFLFFSLSVSIGLGLRLLCFIPPKSYAVNSIVLPSERPISFNGVLSMRTLPPATSCW